MQDDGNFVVYTDHAKPVWQSGVHGSQYKGSKLILEDTGKLVILKGEKDIVWSN